MQFFEPGPPLCADNQFEAIAARLEELLQPGWWDKKQAVASLFGAFSHNYTAVRRLIAKAMAEGVSPQLEGAQSFTVYDCASFGLRLNLWFPEKSDVASDRYRKYLSIDQMHNHDFDFFTMCLSGPGYSSQFWRDADHSFSRKQGEQLDLHKPNLIRLTKGTVLFVERDLDYHSQQWPEAFTTTLNLIPKHFSDENRVQYLIDSDTHKVLEVVQGAS